MAATPLSRNWTWKRLYGRVAMRLGQVKDYQMEPESVLQIGLTTIDELFINSIASFKKKYQTHKDYTVTTDSMGKLVDLGADRVFEVTDLAFNSTTPGASSAYVRGNSSTHLVNYNTFWNPEAAVSGRLYWPELGGDTPKIRVVQGSGVSGEAQLTVWYIRYPDTIVALSDVQAGTKMVDFPDELIPYLAAKWVMTALGEKGLATAENTADVVQTINALDAKILQTDNAERTANTNTLT